MRIVSLLPSATEIVFALGAGAELAGVTFECDHPVAARRRTVVSNTALPSGLEPAELDRVVSSMVAAGEDLYRLDEGALAAIDPDVILTQDLCAVCAVATTDVDEALAHLGCRAQVVTLDPHTLDEVLGSLITVGTVLGRESAATALEASLRARLAVLADSIGDAPQRRVAVLEWTDPAFASGHWVPDLVSAGGGVEVLGAPGGKSVRVGWDRLAAAAPDVVLVAPCGYRLDGAVTLGQEALARQRIPAGPEVWAVDADHLFVRPGPRVVDGAELVGKILHPDRCGQPAGAQARRLR